MEAKKFEWNSFYLRDNPFSTVTRSEAGSPVWAGHKQLKRTMEDTIKISMSSSPSRIIICYGEWGSGKTHAMKYFTNSENLKSLSDELGFEPALSVIMTLPRADVVNNVYTSILEGIGVEEIERRIKLIHKKLGDKRFMKEGMVVNEIAKLIKEPQLAKVLAKLASGDKWKLIVSRYLLMSEKAKDLEDLGIPRGIESVADMLKTLSSIFRLLTTRIENKESDAYSRVILWIDEVEYAENLPGKEMLAIQGFLRDILDYIPSNLLVFLNITLKVGRELKDVVSYLGDSVFERTFEIIYMPELKENDACAYVLDLLNNSAYREPKDKSALDKKNPYFPFNKDSVKYVIGLVGEKKPLTPRRLNDAFASILDNMISDNDLMEVTKKVQTGIPRSYIDKNRKSILATPWFLEKQE